MTTLPEDEETLEKLTDMGETIVEQIQNRENPTLRKPVRSKSNIEYDKERGTLALGDRESTRKFLNISHAKRFMQTMLIASKCKEFIERERTASIRELYYQLKHTVPGIDENTFEDQSDSDPLIVDIETAINTIREQLHLKADPKGRLFGPVTIKDQGDTINCLQLGKSGLGVPSVVDDYEFTEVNADYVLVVETSAMVDRLIEENYHKEHNAIIISMGGQPSRGVRRLVNRFNTEVGLPIYVFTDGDPWGWYIYSTLNAGSMNLAFVSDRLATPNARLIGMSMNDVENYDLWNVTEKLKGKAPDDGGPTKDYKRLMDVRDYPWFQTEKWQEQLNFMLENQIRVEQQALASKELEFVAEEYLPTKIENEDYLD